MKTFRITAAAVAGTVALATAGVAGASAEESHHETAPATVAAPPAQVLFPGITTSTVQRYDQYVTVGQDGTFRAQVPATVAMLDPVGVSAVQSAVSQANQLVRAQHANPHSQAVAGDPLSFQGEHGGIKVDWSGLTLWLDGEATRLLDNVLTLGATARDVLGFLSSIGVVLPYNIGPIAGVVLTAVIALKGQLERCKGPRGFTINATLLGQVTCTARR